MIVGEADLRFADTMLHFLSPLSGRIARKPFLFQTLLVWLVFYAASMLVFMIAWGGPGSVGMSNTQAEWMGYAATAIAALSCWAAFVLVARRIRDLGFSGLHALWLFALCALTLAASGAAPVLSLGLAAIMALIFLALLLLPGTQGDNAYGPPPV